MRTKSTKGAGNEKTAVTMAFKLMTEAEKKWRKIKGLEDLKHLVAGARFKDGVIQPLEAAYQALA